MLKNTNNLKSIVLIGIALSCFTSFGSMETKQPKTKLINNTYANDNMLRTTSIYVLNEDVKDKDVIIASIQSNHHVIILERNENIETLNQKLQKISRTNNIGSINIFSHGTRGEFRIGNEIVNATSIKNNRQIGAFYVLNTILKKTSSLNIFSCSAAEGKNGEILFQSLTDICYFNVAMSDDKTGFEGDWDLERFETEKINHGLNINQLKTTYSHSLQTVPSPYCISSFGTIGTSTITELTADVANSLIYAAGQSSNDFWSFDNVGTATNIAITTGWSSVFHPYVATDIQFLNDTIYFQSQGGEISATYDLGVTNGNIITHTVTPTTGFEAGMTTKNGLIYSTDGNSTAENIYEYNPTTGTSSVVVTGLPGGSYDGLEYCETTGKMYYMSNDFGIYEVDIDLNTLNQVVPFGSLLSNQFANFAIDPSGQYAFVHHGDTIAQYNLTTGNGTDFVAGIPNGNESQDLAFFPSSTLANSYSLYFGGGSTLFEVTGATFALDTVAGITGECSVTPTAPTYTNCLGTITATTTALFPITTQGTTPVSWTYDDGIGSTITVTQNVILNDINSPVADAVTLADVNAECEVTSLTEPTATDNCAAAVTVTNNVVLPITAQGTTVVTWIYDDGNGNTSTQDQNIIIGDVTAPIADALTLADVNAECEVTSLTEPSATDNCTTSVTVTKNVTLPITAQGTTVVTWTYDDGNGNTSTQDQNIIIGDVTAPIADAITLADVNAECEVTSLTEPTATDNCATSVTITKNVTLPITTQGTTVVTWTYDDGNGNTSTQDQNIIIGDVTAPVADAITLADVNAECEVTSLTEPTAADNCAGSISATNNVTLPLTTQGTTVVTWTYDDGNGNISTQDQNIIIGDVTAPVPDVATLTDINAECEVTSLTEPAATDNCAGIVTVANNVTLPLTTQGTTIVTWTYDDGNGNTSTQDQNIIIGDVTAPIPDVATLTDINAECEVTSLTDPAATDNCAGIVTVTNNVTLPLTTQGTTIVTWTYDDGNGNTSTQDQNVIINLPDATVTLSDFTITSANTSATSYQWIDCLNGNMEIIGETNASFTANADGEYAVIVSGVSCSDTSDCVAISGVRIEEANDIKISIYPNPSTGIFNITTSSADINVAIHSIDGKLIINNLNIKKFNQSIDLSHVEKGIYLVKVSNKTSFKIIRLVLQ